MAHCSTSTAAVPRDWNDMKNDLPTRAKRQRMMDKREADAQLADWLAERLDKGLAMDRDNYTRLENLLRELRDSARVTVEEYYSPCYDEFYTA